MRKIVTMRFALYSIMVLMRLEVSVATEAAAATVEFLSRAISVLPSGATEPRNACGRMTIDADWKKLRPSERAASACPSGTVLMPLRSDSHTNADV